MTEIKFPSGTTVFLSDVKVLNPAIDVIDDVIILGVSLPGIRIVQTKHGEEQRPDMVLCIVSSKKFDPETKSFEEGPELFECTLEEFSKRGWFARIPITSLKQRWEADKIREFLIGQAPNVDPYEVYEMVKVKWLYYIDFEKNPGAETFCALWTMGTYFHILFNYFPYLKLSGEVGVGKTKAGIVADGLCFNSELFAGASESSIFRLASDTRGTQIIDEQEQLGDEQVSAYIQVLNSGFQASGAAIRTNKESMKVETYPTYSPKMICSIKGLRETLTDRSIEIVLYRSANQEIRNREPPEWKSKEWAPIRNSLYLLLFQRWKEVRDLYNSLANIYNFEGRFWNIAKPIIAIAKLIDRYAPEGERNVEAELISFLQKVLENKRASALGTNSARVVFALKQALDDMNAKEPAPEDFKRRISIADVIEAGVRWEGEWFRDEFKPKVIASILKNLHLYHNPKRKMGGFTFEVSLSDVKETMARYGIDDHEHDEHNVRDERKTETGVDGKTALGPSGIANADVEQVNSPSETRSSRTFHTSSSYEHNERDEHSACTSSSSSTSSSLNDISKENPGPLGPPGPEQEGTCELYGKFGRLTKSEDGDLVCFDCLNEIYAQQSETKEAGGGKPLSFPQQEPLCPPGYTTEEWSRLTDEQKRKILKGENKP